MDVTGTWDHDERVAKLDLINRDPGSRIQLLSSELKKRGGSQPIDPVE